MTGELKSFIPVFPPLQFTLTGTEAHYSFQFFGPSLSALRLRLFFFFSNSFWSLFNKMVRYSWSFWPLTNEANEGSSCALWRSNFVILWSRRRVLATVYFLLGYNFFFLSFCCCCFWRRCKSQLKIVKRRRRGILAFELGSERGRNSYNKRRNPILSFAT